MSIDKDKFRERVEEAQREGFKQLQGGPRDPITGEIHLGEGDTIIACEEHEELARKLADPATTMEALEGFSSMEEFNAVFLQCAKCREALENCLELRVQANNPQ